MSAREILRRWRPALELVVDAVLCVYAAVGIVEAHDLEVPLWAVFVPGLAGCALLGGRELLDLVRGWRDERAEYVMHAHEEPRSLVEVVDVRRTSEEASADAS